ncbi:cobalamin-dependent protein [bacterium]|nr:cobalamin-dependent protein [candidate division CSSED10-310 bacterium]
MSAMFMAPTPVPQVGLDHLRSRAVTIGLVALYVIENNGIRHIAAMLRRHGYRVIEIYFKDWINNYFQPPTEREVRDLVGILRDCRVDLVGLSVRASAYHRLAVALTHRLRGDLGVPILWGGMHPTFAPEDCVAAADVICLGEAEAPLATLLGALREGVGHTTVEGFWFATPAGSIRNPPAPLVRDLDSLPFRDFHSVDKFYINHGTIRRGDPYAGDPVFLMNASRGCPYATCSYCSNTVLNRVYGNNQFYRRRGVDSVLEELHYARRTFRNLKRIRFDDEVFAFPAAWMERFAARYASEIGLPFDCLLDPRAVDAPRLRILREAGLDLLCVGVQNCERINRSLYHRHVSGERLLRAASVIRAAGVRVSYQIILDDPASTPVDKKNFFDFLLRFPRPYDFYLFSITYYPGTDLTEHLLRTGVIGVDQVEGTAAKVFEQFRVDLGYPRSREDQFWISMIMLLSKRVFGKRLLWRLARTPALRRRPWPLMILAQAANLFKMGWLFMGMLFRGEVNLTLLRRWINLRSLITT